MQEAASELAQQPERAVDVLLNQVLERVEQQLILVLDDYHHLGADTPVHAFLDRLLAYLPDVLHVIIISREMPPLALARLRAQSPLSTIDRSDLLFTDEETQQLFRQVFDLELTPQQLAEYRERTHGWITALQLVRQVAHRIVTSSRDGQTQPPDLVDVLRQSERDIFDYFAEEVFSAEPEELRQLLLKMSLLDRIELDTCTSLYRGHELLTSAAQSGAPQRVYNRRQRRARRRVSSPSALPEFPCAGACEVKLVARASPPNIERCSAYFLERQAWEHAVRHLMAAEEFDRAATVIAEQRSGVDLFRRSRFARRVGRFHCPRTPSKHIHALSQIARRLLACAANMKLPSRCFSGRATLLQQGDDKEGEAEALHSLATLARREADYELAFSLSGSRN